MFGAGAVKENNSIDLVVNIVPWENHVVYDRIGLEEQYTEILDVKIPMNTIPITPGRNLAVILEVAAMNNARERWASMPHWSLPSGSTSILTKLHDPSCKRRNG